MHKVNWDDELTSITRGLGFGVYNFNGETIVRVNDYSVTTSRHMYDIDGGAADDRIHGWKFEENLNNTRKIFRSTFCLPSSLK